MKLRISRLRPGFYFSAAALLFAVAGLVLYLVTYGIEPYALNRWALTCSVLAVWLLLFIAINTLLRGEKPFWTGLLFIPAAFLLVYGMLQFLQPCLSPIAFTFVSSDLNMGDTEANKVIAYYAVATAACYLLSVVCIFVAAFLPAGRRAAGKNAADAARQGRKDI